jgi:hypothetical protein
MKNKASYILDVKIIRDIKKKKTFGFFPRKKVRDCLCKVVKLYAPRTFLI